MKKTFTKSVIAVTVGALTLSSCIGSFGPYQLSSQLEQASYRQQVCQ